MTSDEPFERFEHVRAVLAEQRLKDREECRQLWRETQRHLNELTFKVADTNDTVARLGERLDQFGEESRAADKRLGERIASLVSAMGEFLAKQKGDSGA